ncbi:hypothetical protein BOTCAL_0018g00070 [Botryotinia calthae]|uniref:Uncharacterized protein n=1 Tax=Botryotinia calthae TaxID=38488 RepID=A0A4Y8DHB0_9HELO|nr:hypothetical protein BOTCAL_0018g00070 [Botryotinia calthae]
MGVFSKFLLDIVENLDSDGPNFGHNPLDFVINLARSNTALGEATLKALTKVLNTVENEIHRIDLLVYQCLLIAGGVEINVEHQQQSLICWKNFARILQVLDLEAVCGKYDYERNIFTLQSRLLAHYQLAIKNRQDNPLSQHEQQLLDALKAEKLYLQIKAFLASYYSQLKDFVKAKNQFRDDMINAISVLEDEDPDNDRIGVLYHTGDDRNALNALSLLYPNDALRGSDDDEEKSIRSGPLDAKCEGECGIKWTYADDFYMCKSCYQIIFCGNCLEKLKENRFSTWACHPEHSWLHVPPWKDENAPGKGMVRVMDEAGSPKEVKISDWIKDLKRIWEIE